MGDQQAGDARESRPKGLGSGTNILFLFENKTKSGFIHKYPHETFFKQGHNSFLIPSYLIMMDFKHF